MNMRVNNRNQTSRESSRTEYVHTTSTQLPKGNWLISVLKGDAWLFMNDRDVVLHEGEQVEIDNDDDKTVIRSLYVNGFAKYALTCAKC